MNGKEEFIENLALKKFRTRWLRWLGQKTRQGEPHWTTLFDSNWTGWLNKVTFVTLNFLKDDRESVKAAYSDAIKKADMKQLRKLDEAYVKDKYKI